MVGGMMMGCRKRRGGEGREEGGEMAIVYRKWRVCGVYMCARALAVVLRVCASARWLNEEVNTVGVCRIPALV